MRTPVFRTLPLYDAPCFLDSIPCSSSSVLLQWTEWIVAVMRRYTSRPPTLLLTPHTLTMGRGVMWTSLFLPCIRDHVSTVTAVWPVPYTVVVVVERVQPRLNSIPTWDPAQVICPGPIPVSQVPHTMFHNTLGLILVPHLVQGEPLPLEELITNDQMDTHLGMQVHTVSWISNNVIIIMMSHLNICIHNVCTHTVLYRTSSEVKGPGFLHKVSTEYTCSFTRTYVNLEQDLCDCKSIVMCHKGQLCLHSCSLLGTKAANVAAMSLCAWESIHLVPGIHGYTRNSWREHTALFIFTVVTNNIGSYLSVCLSFSSSLFVYELV